MKKLILLIAFNIVVITLFAQKFSAGSWHSAAICEDGKLYLWGNKPITTNIPSFPKQIGVDNDWKNVQSNNDESVVQKNDGSLWKINAGDTTLTLIDNTADWKNYSIGQGHIIAIKLDGTIWGWGNNSYGQLGDGTLINKNNFVQIGTDNDWQSVSGGWNTSFAIKNDGSLWAWGFNDYGGILGVGNTQSAPVLTPTRVGTDNDWEYIDASFNFAVALKTNRTLWAWGDNYNGPTYFQQFSLFPSQISNDTDWKLISTHGTTLVCIKNDGSLWTLGYNFNTKSNDSLITRIGNDNDWNNVSISSTHCMALKSDSTLWLWGANDDGQLGNGTLIEYDSTISEINNFCKVQINYLVKTEIQNNFLKIYPNPASSQLTVSSTQLANGEKIEIYNAVGVKIKEVRGKKLDASILQGRTSSPQHDSSLEINISALPKGIYLVKVGSESVKLVVE